MPVHAPILIFSQISGPKLREITINTDIDVLEINAMQNQEFELDP